MTEVVFRCLCDCRSGNVFVGGAKIVVNGICCAVIVGLISFVPKDRVYDRGWRASVGDPSPGLQFFRPYVLVLPPGGEVDFVDLRIAGVNSSVSAAITLHSGDEWDFCVPWHQQYWSGR